MMSFGDRCRAALAAEQLERGGDVALGRPAAGDVTDLGVRPRFSWQLRTTGKWPSPEEGSPS